MKRQWLFGALALLLTVPVGLAQAQDQDLRVFAFGAGRGRIGVMVNSRADKARDKIGAEVESVVPDGPADKAGLEAGDIITKFNGTALAGVKADDEDASGPGMKLVELARKLDPGDKVEIEYRRGAENRKATLEAEDMGNSFSFRMPDMERLQRGMNEFRFMPTPLNFEFFGTGRWGGLELVSLNPDLGEYFRRQGRAPGGECGGRVGAQPEARRCDPLHCGPHAEDAVTRDAHPRLVRARRDRRARDHAKAAPSDHQHDGAGFSGRARLAQSLG